MLSDTIVVYTKADCVYCEKFKSYCAWNDILFYEITIGEDITREFFLEEHPDIKTVPAIFINKKYIGGYDDFVKFMGEKYG